MKKLSSLLLLVIIPILSVKGFQTTEPDSGLDVLSWMYEEYEGKWYKNLTFTQETIFYGKNEEIVRTRNFVQ